MFLHVFVANKSINIRLHGASRLGLSYVRHICGKSFVVLWIKFMKNFRHHYRFHIFSYFDVHGKMALIASTNKYRLKYYNFPYAIAINSTAQRVEYQVNANHSIRVKSLIEVGNLLYYAFIYLSHPFISWCFHL